MIPHQKRNIKFTSNSSLNKTFSSIKLHR